jgi:hypothetical protein
MEPNGPKYCNPECRGPGVPRGAPASRDMPYLSWAESTQQLLDVVLGQRWYKVYTPDSAIEGRPES